MDSECEIIASLIEVMQAAIDRGDWCVDGACEPDSDMWRAKYYLRQHGYVENSIDNSWMQPA